MTALPLAISELEKGGEHFLASLGFTARKPVGQGCFGSRPRTSRILVFNSSGVGKQFDDWVDSGEPSLVRLVMYVIT